MKIKSIKDNVHGYIELEEKFWNIIDTPQFQRLKWIEQTSYRVLYPSARHDRFVHSIGTFHLGKIALKGFKNNVSSNLDNCEHIIDKFSNSFLLACLLHDVGHAPFSHSCEDLFNYKYKVSDESSKINIKLFSTIQNSKYFLYDARKKFIDDYKFIIKSTDIMCKAPSEHEIMSSIIIIENDDTFIGKSQSEDHYDLDFIIRAIMGCVYGVKSSDSNEIKLEKGIKNCLIRLLNSTTVDVDKLDYIARDTMMSGYQNLIIDNERLLSSLSMIKKGDVYYPSFRKNALSVIDNVIIAKNALSNWIINHPIVQYDYYLLRQVIGIAINRLYETQHQSQKDFTSVDDLIEKIFSPESLSYKGCFIGENKYCLLSDIEILHLLKQAINEIEVHEFFERGKRRKPIWKSLAEYIFCLPDKDNATTVADFFAPLITAINGIKNLAKPKYINQEYYNYICNNNHSINGADNLINILNTLNSYCIMHNLKFDFVIIPVKYSFSSLINYKNTFIQFENSINNFICYDSLLHMKDINTPPPYGFFYLYSRDKIKAQDFLDFILNKANESKVIRC